MLQHIDEDNFLKRVVFSDEATFHISDVLNRHNVRIWGSEHLHESHEIVRKVNVWCGVMCDRIIGPFFFTERTTTSSSVYLGMLTEFVIPQLKGMQNCHISTRWSTLTLGFVCA
ncbi:hypothetical protein PR048_007179 [Dryococelus australis]|uniref:Transposase n=1 Tax=Dryococelus australis TaxID=614101 RepID=A0ABQ9ICX2_9NEOP|nr:hypothetical protein PR048_007179 [Dryococelus australis]